MASWLEGGQREMVNVASVPQRSPLRYPGGKTWLVPTVRRWLAGLPWQTTLVEPFAGGGIVSLTAVMEGFVSKAVLCERDPGVAAFWRACLEDNEWLARQIEDFVMTRENVQELLGQPLEENRQLGFLTLVRNRVNRGGILAPGAGMVKEGEAGKGVQSRWYPDTLARRVRQIGAFTNQLEVVEGDAMERLAEWASSQGVALFVDPPYTAGAGKRAGRRLYLHNELDHARLFVTLAAGNAPFLMTYDDTQEVVGWAQRHGFEVGRVAMKSTHHAQMQELLITRGVET